MIGLIDFGDNVHSYRVSDLAVAIAYGLFNQDDPLAAAANIVRGYNSENPLIENELNVLWDLVKMRLCMSVLSCGVINKASALMMIIYRSASSRFKILYRSFKKHPSSLRYCSFPTGLQYAADSYGSESGYISKQLRFCSGIGIGSSQR